MAMGVFLRSPHAHAIIKAIEAAAAMPGVAAIFTGADLAADEIGGLPCAWGVSNADGSPMKEPPRSAMAVDKVRCVGDALAFVVADTLDQAREAADAIVIDYEVLSAVVGVLDAIRPGAAAVFDEIPNNSCFDWECGDAMATAAAFRNAAHIAKISLVNNRLVGNPMEPRAAVAEYDAGRDHYTMWTTSQFPHVVKVLMGNFVLNIPQHKLRIIAPDVGGGFGVKQFLYAEEVVTTWASRKVNRPVKWVNERSEGFLSDAHGRDHVSEAELALDENGKFLGLKVRTIANMGGYLSTFGPNIPTNLYGLLLAGVYTTPAIHCEVKGVFTNTVPVDAYRGAGRPEATFLLERLVDVAARDLGIDRTEIRRRNFIPRDAFPYQTPVMLQYDSGDHDATLAKALEVSRWSNFPARRDEAARRGKLRGIGIVTYIEACGLAPSRIARQLGARGGLFESASVRVNPSGDITVFTGSHNHGQGHETVFAQIVGDMLGVSSSLVEIVHGDTARSPFGLGTYGSRSAAVGGAAIAKAVGKIIDKGRKIAGYLLEASEQDIEFAAGKFTVSAPTAA